MGSLVTALASYLDARHHAGSWLVRMEDLDPPREETGASDRILQSLEAHNLHPDEPVLFQSSRLAAYEEALRVMDAGGHLFSCDCSRAEMGTEGVCRGVCRNSNRSTDPDEKGNLHSARAERVKVSPGTVISFADRLLGPQMSDLGESLADFVVKRKDGLHAYQLAVVVDDAHQGITQVVRGSDLLDSTPRQIYLQQLQGYHTPGYCHIPVLTNRKGQKLSKQSHARAIDDIQSTANLRRALEYLQQPAPPVSASCNSDILDFAAKHWSIERLPATLAIPLNPV
jgi:glutamyl-Q tRNA(Asp) synthetase